MKMIYLVHIGYNDFEFTDGHTALSFAALALNSSTEKVKAEIDLIPTPASKKEEEDDDF